MKSVGLSFGAYFFMNPTYSLSLLQFFSRLTNIDETVEIGFLCTAITCLSWLAGRVMAYVLGRIRRVKAIVRNRMPVWPAWRPQRHHVAWLRFDEGG